MAVLASWLKKGTWGLGQGARHGPTMQKVTEARSCYAISTLSAAVLFVLVHVLLFSCCCLMFAEGGATIWICDVQLAVETSNPRPEIPFVDFAPSTPPPLELPFHLELCTAFAAKACSTHARKRPDLFGRWFWLVLGWVCFRQTKDLRFGGLGLNRAWLAK